MLRLRFVAQIALLAAALCAPLRDASAKDEYEDIQNLVAQKEQIENRIGDLQIRINAASAQSAYCSAEERQADLRYLRSLQREAKALGQEYDKFKQGFIDLATTPTAGPALIQAGVHPDDRKYWIVDDNDVQKLTPSALSKANQVEKANIVDCEAKKTAPAQTAPPAEQPPATIPPPEPKTANRPRPGSPSPQTRPLGPTAPLGGPLPGTGCTDKERHDAILRLQEEILRVEQELIPIDGTTKEGRARQLQLIAELDRLKALMALACPPLLPPRQPPPPPPVGPTTPLGGSSYPPPPSKTPTFKIGKPLVQTPPKLQNPLTPGEIKGPIYLDPFVKLEDEADDALDDLEDAMDDCDVDAVKGMIANLEALSTAAHAAADAAFKAGNYGRAFEARAMARDLDEAIKDAKEFKCLIRPGRYLLLDSSERRIIEIHNEERAQVHAAPLKWDFKLQWDAGGYAQQMAQTGQLVHAPREGRGIERENLGQGRLGWSPDRIITDEWLSEKRYFHAGFFPNICTGDWTQCAHYSQMIWPTTTGIGCGWATGTGFEWVVCRYSPGGNKDGKPVGLPNVPQRG